MTTDRKFGDFLNYGYYYRTPEMTAQLEHEKKEIKFLGKTAGLCVILYVVFQNLLSIPLYLERIKNLYLSDEIFRYSYSIVYSVLGLLIPFMIGAVLISRKIGKIDFRLAKPHSMAEVFSAVPFGFFVCLAANQITSWFVALAGSVGFELNSPDTETPSTIPARLVYIIAVAVIPALVEEFAIRGVVMMPLRKYGDWFAITASAAVFAILHGNLVQAPFAFIAGMGIGYAVCVTGSIWSGILIHFCNNLYSVMTEYMIAGIADEEKLNLLFFAVTIMLTGISFLGSVFFVIAKCRRKSKPTVTVISTGGKWKSFCVNAAMIIAVIIMLYITSSYVTFTGFN